MKHCSIEPLETRIAPATLSINSVSIAEGDTGEKDFTFTVTLLDPPAAGNVTVDFLTGPSGTATAGDDYTALSLAMLTFLPTETEKTITVKINGDTAGEANETFQVLLSNPVNATISAGTGTGTILNDAKFAITTPSVQRLEGNSGTTAFTFAVAITESPLSGSASVNYHTADGTATVADQDYTAAMDTLTFNAGVTSRTFTVLAKGDLLSEADETFSVILDTPSTAASITVPTGTGTIQNDPGIGFSTPTVAKAEGNSGTTPFDFTVTLTDAPLTGDVSANFHTADGSATVTDNDYNAATGTVTFLQGVTTQTVTVFGKGDLTSEVNQSFTVILDTPSPGATITAGTGTATLQNDSSLAITSPSVSHPEGNSGNTNFVFTVTITERPLSGSVTANFHTVDGTATLADGDYNEGTGTVTFTPGVDTRTFTVSARGDTRSEADESFTVVLDTPSTAASITVNTGTATILNDPGLTIDSAEVFEGNAGLTPLTFTVTLTDGPAVGDVTVDYAIADGTATVANSDYQTIPAGTLTFTPGGVTQQTITVQVAGDTAQENDETLQANLSNPVGASFFSAAGVPLVDDMGAPLVTMHGTGTIKTDPLTFTATAPSIVEGASGVTTLNFEVTLSDIDRGTNPVKVNYSTPAGTAGAGVATAGSDFSNTSGTLTFAAGETVKTIAVPIYGDTTPEPDETFSFRVAFAPQAQQVTGITVPASFNRTATGSILNDELSVAIADLSVAEGASDDAMNFSVTLTGSPQSQVTVHLTTIAGTALAGQDFVAKTDTLVWNPGDAATKQFEVVRVGDAVAELGETFTVQITQVVFAGTPVTIADGTATGTIRNDDLTLKITSDAAQKEGDSGTTGFGFTVAVVDGAGLPVTNFGQPLTVSYSTQDGTATAASGDYIATSSSLNLAAMTASERLVIPVRGDLATEGNETFSVRLAESIDFLLEPAVAPVTTPATATATITNDDPHVRINDVTVIEGTGGAVTAIFTVSLSGAQTHEVTVNFATEDGTAVDGVGATEGTSDALAQDYVAQGRTLPGTLTFAPGETTKTIAVQVLGDSRRELAEDFKVVLSNAKIAQASGDPVDFEINKAVGTATITDNDTTLPTLSIADATVREGNTGSTAAIFAITLSAVADFDVTGKFEGLTIGGSGGAESPVDFTALPLTTFTIPAGSTSVNVQIPVNSDMTEESDETFQVRISQGALAITPTAVPLTATRDTALGTIVNDDILVSFVTAAAITEGAAPTLDFRVTLSQASTSHDVVVHYTTESGSAIAGQDFTAMTGSITIPQNQLEGVISIPILDDTLDEVDTQTFQVRITGVTNGFLANRTLPAPTATVATGTITDNDAAPTISFDPATLTVAEGVGAAGAVFTVKLSNGSERGNVTVNYSTTAGSATGDDFTAQAGTELTIPSGATMGTFSIPITADSLDEADETFTVTLSDPTGGTLGATLTASGTITDDDTGPTVRIADVGDSEAAGKLTFTVTLSELSGRPVTVHFQTVDSTALSASDYTNTMGDLTIPAGQLSGTFDVPVTLDTTLEPDERLLARLSAPVNATILDNEGTGTIQNDETVFTTQTLSIGEEDVTGGAQTLTVRVSRSGPTTSTASVQYATADGTAVGGKDFTAIAGTLNFAVGQGFQDLFIPITRDTTFENAEQFTLVLSNPVDGVLGAAATGTITIVDNDTLPTISVGPAQVTEGTGAQTLVFTVRLSNASEVEDITVLFDTVDGTAVSTATFDKDFTAQAGELKFLKGETLKTVTVVVQNDTRDEDTQTMQLALRNPNFATLSANSTATGTIFDDDATPTVSVSDLSLGENESGLATRVFTVSLSAPSEFPVTVSWNTEATTSTTLTPATAGVDYTAVAATLLTFAPGEQSKTIAVEVFDDALDEAAEAFDVVLTAPTAATLLDARGLGTITDNDAAPVIAINDVTVDEDGTSAIVFRVTLSGPSGRVLTVPFSTQDSTATSTGAFKDFVALTSSLTFQAGEVVKEISIALLDDSFREGAVQQGAADYTLDAERFTVVLGSAENVVAGDTTGEGTINPGADTGIGLTVTDVARVEGDSGTSTLTFQFQLSAPSPGGGDFTIATRNGTAIAGTDYTALAAQTVTIQGDHDVNGVNTPGPTTHVVNVSVTGDQAFEATESFFLDASAFSTALTALGTDSNGALHLRGTIYNDDLQAFNGGKSAQWIDVDGDLVTLTVTKGNLAAMLATDFVLTDAGTVGGKHLDLLNLLSNIPGFFGASITITAEPQPGFTGVTDGLVHVGEIRAGGATGVELTWIGLDLGTITVEGDLAKLRAGDNTSTTALRKLDVMSLGTKGAGGTLDDVISEVLGPVGSIVVHGDVGGLLSVFGAEFGTIGKLEVEGVLRGGALGNSGLIKSTGRMASVELGGIVGGSGAASGLLFGNTASGGSIGKVVVHGDIVGGSGEASGRIVASRIGTVTVDSILGGSGASSGTIASETTLGDVKVLGSIIGGDAEVGSTTRTAAASGRITGAIMEDITIGGTLQGGTGENSGRVDAQKIGHASLGAIVGGAGAFSGTLLSSGALGKVVLTGGLTGGSGSESGKIAAARVASVSVGGAVTGGSGSESGSIEGGNLQSGATDDTFQLTVLGSIGDVTVGSLKGGTGVRSGAIISTGELGKVRVLGDVEGGTRSTSGTVFGLGKVVSVSVGGDLIGGANNAGSIATRVSIGSVLVEGDVLGGAGINSGSIIGNADTAGVLGKVTVRGALIGGAGGNSGKIFAATLGDVSVDSLTGAAGESSGTIVSTVAAGTITVVNGITGGLGSESGGISLNNKTKAISIGGAIVGGAGADSGSIRATDDVPKITIGQNTAGQSLVGGSGLRSGRVAITADLPEARLAGDIVGGTGQRSGGFTIGGILKKISIGGDILGGDSPVVGDALVNSGFLQAGLLGTATVTGSLIAGTDNGAGLANSGVIRTGRLESLTIGGNVTGNATTAAIISAAASIDTSDVGIKNLVIRGNVAFAEILAGYDGAVSPADGNFRGNLASADAQIGKVEIGGTVRALNLVAGAAAGGEGRFGDATDVLASGATVRDSARVISQIASVILRGSIVANAASYGIVAQHLVSVKLGAGAGTPLAGLAKGAGNDTFGTTNNTDLIGAPTATNFRAVEIAV